MSELSIILSYALFASCALFFGVRCLLALRPGKNTSIVEDRYESIFGVGRWILLGIIIASVILLIIEVVVAELQANL